MPTTKVDVILYAVEKSLERLQVRAVAQQRSNCSSISSECHMGSHYRQGPSAKKERHEFLPSMSPSSLKLPEPAGQVRLWKKIATLESGQPGIRARPIIEPLQGWSSHGEDKKNSRPQYTAYRRKDLEHFKARVRFSEDGSRHHPSKLNGLETSDPKLIGKQLNHIARKRHRAHRQARTHQGASTGSSCSSEAKRPGKRARPGAEPFCNPG
ncbi:MAG: hypothetical protein ACLVEJ_01865 [Parabacteroides sp.]